jgi:hypothetical protein
VRSNVGYVYHHPSLFSISLIETKVAVRNLT